MAPKFTDLTVWGLQDIDAAGDEKEASAILGDLPDSVNLLVTWTYDQMCGLTKNPRLHPVRVLAEKLNHQLQFGSGDSALVYGSSSAAIDRMFFHLSS